MVRSHSHAKFLVPNYIWRRKFQNYMIYTKNKSAQTCPIFYEHGHSINTIIKTGTSSAAVRDQKYTRSMLNQVNKPLLAEHACQKKKKKKKRKLTTVQVFHFFCFSFLLIFGLLIP